MLFWRRACSRALKHSKDCVGEPLKKRGGGAGTYRVPKSPRFGSTVRRWGNRWARGYWPVCWRDAGIDLPRHIPQPIELGLSTFTDVNPGIHLWPCYPQILWLRLQEPSNVYNLVVFSWWRPNFGPA